MKNQQIFDKVCERLRDGTGRAVNDKGRCLYLESKSGLKCAVGIFIKDGHEAQKYLGSVFRLLEDYKEEDLFGFEFENEKTNLLLKDFQIIHDEKQNWYGIEFINEDIVKSIADEYNLKYNPPN